MSDKELVGREGKIQQPMYILSSCSHFPLGYENKASFHPGLVYYSLVNAEDTTLIAPATSPRMSSQRAITTATSPPAFSGAAVMVIARAAVMKKKTIFWIPAYNLQRFFLHIILLKS